MNPSNTQGLIKELVDLDIKAPSEEEKNPLVNVPSAPEQSKNVTLDLFELFQQKYTPPSQVDGVPNQPPAPSFWTLEYYKEYFDISTEDAIQRIKKAIWPFGSDSFVDTEHKSDLYIPIWTFITLIITMSTFGSIMHGLKKANDNQSNTVSIILDINKVTSTCTILFFYLAINPAILYGLLKYKGSKIKLCEILCLYGYSYVPFIPMSLLFAIQIPLLQIIVLFGAAIISTYFLCRNLGEMCQNYLQTWMDVLKPYMIIVQIIFTTLIYFKIYN